MHLNNRKWLEDLKKDYPDNFEKCSVLEIGSQNVNGTARDYFKDCEYIGVDREEGEWNEKNCILPYYDFKRSYVLN